MLQSFNYVKCKRWQEINNFNYNSPINTDARVYVFIKEKIDFEFIIRVLWLKAFSMVLKRSIGIMVIPEKKLVRCYLSMTCHSIANRVSRWINVVLFEWENYLNFPFPLIVSLPLVHVRINLSCEIRQKSSIWKFLLMICSLKILPWHIEFNTYVISNVKLLTNCTCVFSRNKRYTFDKSTRLFNSRWNIEYCHDKLIENFYTTQYYIEFNIFNKNLNIYKHSRETY